MMVEHKQVRRQRYRVPWDEDYDRAQQKAAAKFRALMERLMEERGITIEELHARFLETGWRLPIPGRHADEPVKLDEFKLHCARAYPSVYDPYTYQTFIRGMMEALDLTDREAKEFMWWYAMGSLGEPPAGFLDEA